MSQRRVYATREITDGRKVNYFLFPACESSEDKGIDRTFWTGHDVVVAEVEGSGYARSFKQSSDQFNIEEATAKISRDLNSRYSPTKNLKPQKTIN